MKRKLRRMLLLFALLVLSFGAWLWVAHYRAKRAVETYKNQLIALGEKLTVDELWPPQIPAEQNGAEFFLEAEKLLDGADGLIDTNPPSAMPMVSPGRAMVRSLQPDVRGFEGTNSWQELESTLTTKQKGLQLLQQIAGKPVLDFGVDYHKGLLIRFSHVAKCKQFAKLLSAAVEADLHQGDATTALSRVRTILALVKGLENDRTMISQLVRIAIATIAANTTWELLQSRQINGQQFESLQQEWRGLEFIKPAEATLSMERAMNDLMLEGARRRDSSRKDFINLLDAFSPGWNSPTNNGKGRINVTAWQVSETIWRIWWSYPDQQRALQTGQVLIDTVRKARADGFIIEALRQQTNRLDDLHAERFTNEPTNTTDAEIIADLDMRTLFTRAMVAMDNYLSRVMTIEAARQMTITAIALKRYQLQHGDYPKDLPALTPAFLPATPRDPVDGKPLRYRPDDDGSFLLYSVGADGVDGGGDAYPVLVGTKSFQWQKGRDWVWPQPATEEEIELRHQSLQKKLGE